MGTPLREMAFFGDLVSTAFTAEEFALQIERSLATGSSEDASRRIAFARAHTWSERALALETEASRMLDGAAGR